MKEYLKHKVFNCISECADELGYETYVIGGYVRDCILKRKEPKDIDVVCVGSGIELAKKVAQSISIPVIGIGAGKNVDGQVLVLHDMIGMTHEFSPRFLRRYLNLFEDIKSAVESYVDDVKSVDFPNDKEQY